MLVVTTEQASRPFRATDQAALDVMGAHALPPLSRPGGEPDTDTRGPAVTNGAPNDTDAGPPTL